MSKNILMRMRQIKDELDELNDLDHLTSAEEKRFDELVEEFDRLKRKDDKSEIDKFMQEPLTRPIKPDLRSYTEPDLRLYNRNNLDELRSYIRNKGKILAPTREISVARYFYGLLSGDWRGAQSEWQLRAITGETGSGLVFIPEEISSEVIFLALSQNQCVNAGIHITPMISRFKTIPKQTSPVETEWKKEAVAFTKSRDITFEPLNLVLKVLMALIEISVEMSEDTGGEIGKAVQDAMALALSNELDNAILNGSGENGIEGIVNTEGILTETYTDLDYSVFSKAYTKLLNENCKAENIAMIIDPAMLGELDILVDTTGQSIEPPESYKKIRILPTNQLEEKAVMGDYSQVVLGVRKTMQASFMSLGRSADLETSREALTAFEKLTYLIRGYLRADSGVKLPEHLCLISPLAS